ncbi:hypothetical protein ACFYQA_34260 [Streptomyces sp. NPDC005774]|uniref:hypothetical protein n=1 Tax=Streptomyces sp. NPDC005774 TaxID=3364728 RepID=UPI0036A453FE
MPDPKPHLPPVPAGRAALRTAHGHPLRDRTAAVPDRPVAVLGIVPARTATAPDVSEAGA